MDTFDCPQHLQAFHFPRRPLAAALPPVFVVHVEDQIDGFALLQHSNEQDPGQEGLTCAAFAEDAVGARDELLQVETELCFHVERVPDEESLLVFLPEYQFHIVVRSKVDRSKMSRDGLHGLRLLDGFRIDPQRQIGLDMQNAEGARAA